MYDHRVFDYFQDQGLHDRILRFDQSCATVDLAAETAQIAPGQVAKSLSFWVGKDPLMVVMAGDRKVDNGKYKARFGRRPKMMTAAEALDVTGHAIGSVCPFVLKEAIPVYLDISLQGYDRVYPAAGTPDSLIGLDLAELVHHSQALGWVDVGK